MRNICKMTGIFLSLVMMLLILPARVYATEKVVASGKCGENVTWTLIGTEETGYTLTISGSGAMDNYTAITHPKYYYRYGDGIKKVIIENGVTSIGNYAFDGCSALTDITIPESVTIVGENVFSDCSGLKTAGPIGGDYNCKYGWTDKIPDYAFQGSNGLTGITIPESVMSIGDSAFGDCSNLTGITIPEGVTSIGDWAFESCSRLTDVTIPEGVTSIGENVFWNCSGLTSVTIPESVTSIGKSAFARCSSLTGVTIPEGVTSIGKWAFEDCSSLADITIPGSVTSIEYKAFLGCSSLTGITIWNSSASIGEYAFGMVYSNGSYHPVENFIVHGDYGSTAEKYANENGLKFEGYNEKNIKAFVERLYTNVLGRQGDKSGIEDWTNKLVRGTKDSISVSYGFVFSDEFKNRNLTNEQKVDILYTTFLNRLSDEGGRKIWVDALNSGVDFEKVFQGFVMSDEFAGICESYGLTQGDISLIQGMTEILARYRNQNIFLTCFVARCYTKVLQRGWDTDGIETWCKLILTNEWTPRNVAANGFFHSDEFINKNTNNAEYVSILYQTFLGREVDEQGATMWIGLLDRNEWTRDQVLDGFADSDEFKTILASFGLN